MRKLTIGISVSHVSPMLRAYIKLLEQHGTIHTTQDVTPDPVIIDWELVKQLVPKTLP